VQTRPVRTPGDLGAVDGIVLPGGESTTMSLLLASSELMEPLRKVLSSGLPAFGTCAGMILLAARITDGRPDQRCYGIIDLTVQRNGYGRQRRSFECDLDVLGTGGGPVHAVFIRAPLVVEAGPDVEVLASLLPSPDDEKRAPATGIPATTAVPVLCRQGPVLVSAFHPELTGDRRLHQMFVSMIEDRER
jgi:5'-phosphate synthase pdxT subunit